MLSYLFTTRPGSDFSYYIPMLIIAGLLILSSIIFAQIYQKKKKTDIPFKKLFKKLSSRLFLFGILFLILLALRYENIPYFSMRIWFYLAIIAALYNAYKYLKAYFKEYPMKKNEVISRPTKKKQENKYTANKKRR